MNLVNETIVGKTNSHDKGHENSCSHERHKRMLLVAKSQPRGNLYCVELCTSVHHPLVHAPPVHFTNIDGTEPVDRVEGRAILVNRHIEWMERELEKYRCRSSIPGTITLLNLLTQSSSSTQVVSSSCIHWINK